MVLGWKTYTVLLGAKLSVVGGVVVLSCDEFMKFKRLPRN